MAHTDFVVLEQDAMGLGTHGTRACKRHDVAFGHDGSTNVRVEFAVIVNDSVKLFFISGFKGGFVLGKDAHDSWLGRNHIMTPSVVYGEKKRGETFEFCIPEVKA